MNKSPVFNMKYFFEFFQSAKLTDWAMFVFRTISAMFVFRAVCVFTRLTRYCQRIRNYFFNINVIYEMIEFQRNS